MVYCGLPSILNGYIIPPGPGEDHPLGATDEVPTTMGFVVAFFKYL